MTLLKTSDLTGPALDWAVATALGISFTLHRGRPAQVKHFDPEGPAHDFDASANKMYLYLQYSTNWADGGPLLEPNDIIYWRDGENFRALMPDHDSCGGYYDPDCGVLDVSTFDGQEGPTALIAATRCLVSQRFGQDIDVPDEVAACAQ